jgi:hypothetical protein
LSFCNVKKIKDDIIHGRLTLYLLRIGWTKQVQLKYRLKKLGDLIELKAEQHPLNGTVYYRVDNPSILTVTGFHYQQPGTDAFFWAGEKRVNGGCNDDNVGDTSYSLAPGEIGSKTLVGL